MIVTFFLGQRTLDDCRTFINDLVSRISTKPLFTSDELPHYETVLRECFCHLEEQPKTGKRGRPRNPKVIVDPDLKYATVHKTREDGKIVKVERKIVFGEPKHIENIIERSPVSKKINTSFIERVNLTLRHNNKKLARKTICFAKRKKSLEAQTSITVTHYNFSRPHGSLTQKGPDRIKVERTPAMAANLIDRVWPMDEILAIPLAKPNND